MANKQTALQKLVVELEGIAEADVIVYATSSRQGLSGAIADDQVPVIFRHLSLLNPNRDKAKRLVIVLHTLGGVSTVPWRIVSLIREYYGELIVMVPYCAFSAGTTLALGADVIKMHPVAVLGPTDPTVSNAFNPTDQFGNGIGISVEDVSAYINLIKDDVGIRHEDELVQAFTILADKVHPLALGNVKRHIQQTRTITERIIRLRNDGANLDDHAIKELIEAFTSRMFFHGHPISRREAKDYLNLTTVQDCADNEIDCLGRIYDELVRLMALETEFNPVDQFLAEKPKINVSAWEISSDKSAILATMESRLKSSRYNLTYHIAGTRMTEQNVLAHVIRTQAGWK